MIKGELDFLFQAKKCTVCSMMGLLNDDNKVVRVGGVGFLGALRV